MVQGVPSLNSASDSEEMMPLPYWRAPASADADPAILGAASRAQAVDVAAMIPFIEKNTKTVPTMTLIPPTPVPVLIASTIVAETATSAASLSKDSSGKR